MFCPISNGVHGYSVTQFVIYKAFYHHYTISSSNISPITIPYRTISSDTIAFSATSSSTILFLLHCY